MRGTKKLFIYFLPAMLLGALLLYLLYWRWQISTTRFFDIDEFSYLHWAADLARGQRPYTDFFMFFTPGFLWLFAPLTKIFSFNPEMYIAARVVSYIIFLGMLLLLGLLFRATRSKRWTLLPIVLLAFLPIPYDKYLEVRPDNLATFFALLGLVFETFGILSERKNTSLWFWSGVSFTGSLLVFVKTVPFVMVGISIAVLYAWWGKEERFIPWCKKLTRFLEHTEILAFILGLGIPFLLFVGWIISLGDIGKAWYSLTKLPFEANMIGKLGIMEPHLFFFPNGSFYGGSNGITAGLLWNHTIWFIGIMMGVYRFFTPFLSGEGNRKKVLVEALVSGVFLLSVFGYVQFFPLKHSQYLIPIALFIAYYCADFLVIVFRHIDGILPLFGILALLLVGLYAMGRTTIQVNQIKLSWTNAVQLEQLKLLAHTIPPNAQVLDLEGRMLFWKDAYYICCVPFGSFLPFLSRPPRPLQSALEENRVPYIFQGDSNRLWDLTGDLPYITAHYERVPGWGDALWKRTKL